MSMHIDGRSCKWGLTAVEKLRFGIRRRAGANLPCSWRESWVKSVAFRQRGVVFFEMVVSKVSQEQIPSIEHL